MTGLVRLKVGAFDIAHAWTLAQIQEMAACGEEEVKLAAGHTLLVSAEAESVTLEPEGEATILESYV